MFLEGPCWQREYRGPTIEKKSYTLENFVFTDFCFPQKQLNRLVSFINAVHRIDVTNKNTELEKMFFFKEKGVSPKTFLKDIVISGGYGRPMIEGKNNILENFFTENHFI